MSVHQGQTIDWYLTDDFLEGMYLAGFFAKDTIS